MFQSHQRLLFLSLLTIELLSLTGHFFPSVNTAVFVLLIIIFTILTLKRLEYGLYIVLAELFIGSKGYLFSLDLGGLELSVRMGLWVVLMGITLYLWLRKVVKGKLGLREIGAMGEIGGIRALLVLLGFIGYGLFRAWWLGNEPANIFFDANAWLFFGLVLPFLYILIYGDIKTFSQNSLNLLLYAALWLSIKTLVLLYFFSHNFLYTGPEVYRWVRDTGIGEITQMESGFARIFIQSQIYILIAILLSIFKIAGQKFKDLLKNSEFYFLAIFLAATLVSLSRTNWLGIAVGIGLAGLYVLLKYKLKITLRLLGQGMTVAVAAVILLFVIIKFPLPGSYDINAAAALAERTRNIDSEAGASSRWSLLPVLNQGIKEHPLLGSGFGATLTYKSADPRILEQNPEGLYTTYAFEWGWHSLWFKLGLGGLLAYLAFIGAIFHKNRQNLPQNEPLAALLIGLAVITVIHIFSPYLDHPLGIGYVLFLYFYTD